ncbi:MAG: hypothetical protein ACYC3S_15670 [Chloroflexota bacterium]
MINDETSPVRWEWLYKVGGLAALTISGLFLVGMVGIVATTTGLTPADSRPAPLQNNWLVVLFSLNAGLGEVRADALSVFCLLDLAIMALFCLVFLALYVALRGASTVWTVVAASLPFLGIPLYLVTSTAGRSGLLLAGLLVSKVLLRANTFDKAGAYIGIVAGSLLLFVGDIGTAVFSTSTVIAAVVGIGYVLWVMWLLMVARWLFRLGQGVSQEKARHVEKSPWKAPLCRM